MSRPADAQGNGQPTPRTARPGSGLRWALGRDGIQSARWLVLTTGLFAAIFTAGCSSGASSAPLASASPVPPAASAGLSASSAPATAVAASAPAPASLGGTASGSGACTLLSPADIQAATGLSVAAGKGATVGDATNCTWKGSARTQVIVTLGSAQSIGLALTAAEQSGATDVAGIGSKAAIIQGAAFQGGGYIINVLDASGGFGLSVLGSDAITQAQVEALAKLVETRR